MCATWNVVLEEGFSTWILEVRHRLSHVQVVDALIKKGDLFTCAGGVVVGPSWVPAGFPTSHRQS